MPSLGVLVLGPAQSYDVQKSCINRLGNWLVTNSNEINCAEYEYRGDKLIRSTHLSVHVIYVPVNDDSSRGLRDIIPDFSMFDEFKEYRVPIRNYSHDTNKTCNDSERMADLFVKSLNACKHLIEILQLNVILLTTPNTHIFNNKLRLPVLTHYDLPVLFFTHEFFDFKNDVETALSSIIKKKFSFHHDLDSSVHCGLDYCVEYTTVTQHCADNKTTSVRTLSLPTLTSPAAVFPGKYTFVYTDDRPLSNWFNDKLSKSWFPCRDNYTLITSNTTTMIECNKTKLLFLIPNTVHVSQKLLYNSIKRSASGDYWRLREVVDQVRSIRKYVHDKYRDSVNVDIVLCEFSKLLAHEAQDLYNAGVTHIYTFDSCPQIQDLRDNYSNRSVPEAKVLSTVLSMLLNFSVTTNELLSVSNETKKAQTLYDYYFVMGGRYKFHNGFSLHPWEQTNFQNISVKLIGAYKSAVETILYGFPHSALNFMQKALSNVFTNCLQTGIDIEHSLYNELTTTTEHKLLFLESLHASGFSGPTCSYNAA